MINSRSIDDLLPGVAAMCRRLIEKCKERGIEILITSTYRDMESQAALYEQGRTKPGRIVTNAKAGQSYHQYRCAFDFVPIINGKAQWDDLGLIAKCGEIGESVGLTWAGRWITFKELLHFQYSEKTLSQLYLEQEKRNAI
jgi:peptidoglycan L-alanyl-D-glutamate endopeptidase CwlK